MMKVKTAILIALATVVSLAAAAHSHYWEQRVTLFDKLPVNEQDIVFLGNSITDGGEFAELFKIKNVKNRGISADVISGVRERLHQVTSGHPAKIFLLIGINDVSHKKTAAQIAGEYEMLVKEIREQSPETELFVQSVMPINNDFQRYKNLFGTEQVVVDLNKELVRIAAENGATYIDLWPALADPETGKLKTAYTNDGLHLTGNGYHAWVNHIAQYVKDGQSAADAGVANEESVSLPHVKIYE